VYGFDFDLYRCVACNRFWVFAWRTVGGWEAATEKDAATMQALEGDALKAFMKTWAEAFN
jgi:hypothetical protein